MDLLYFFKENFKLDFKSELRYRFNFYSDIIVFVVLLSVFFLSETGTSFGKTYSLDYKWLFLVGYLLWTSSIACIQTMATYFPSEAQLGTLHNSLNSSFDIKSILLVDTITIQIIHLLKVILVMIFAALVWNVDIILNPYLIIPLILNIVGFYGIGLILAGMSLYFKKINSINFIIKLLLLFITDTVPTNKILKGFTSLIPLTISNELARNISVGLIDYTLILELLSISVFYIVIGVVIFNYLFKKSKNKSNILFY